MVRHLAGLGGRTMAAWTGFAWSMRGARRVGPLLAAAEVRGGVNKNKRRRTGDGAGHGASEESVGVCSFLSPAWRHSTAWAGLAAVPSSTCMAG